MDEQEKKDLAAVKKDGCSLEFIENQTKKICLAAVKQNGNALEFVKEQTEEICLIAVRKYGYDIEFVKEQTEEICIEAVRGCYWALYYIKNPNKKICLEAMKYSNDALRWHSNFYKLTPVNIEEEYQNFMDDIYVDPNVFRCDFNVWLESQLKDEQLIEIDDKYYRFSEVEELIKNGSSK